jgi:branched-chain amino acid transport system substrate-binding protein
MPLWYGNAIGSTSGILYHYSAPDNAANDFLATESKARYNVMPDLFAADGMNAAIMLVEGLLATNGDASGAALIAVFEGMSFEGPKGTIYIRPEDHVAIQDMYVLKLVNLTDPDANFYEYVETTRPEPPCLLPEALVDRCGDLPVGSLSGE